MITKEEYIRLRSTNQMSIELAYEYYCLHAENPLEIGIFASYFSEYFKLYHPTFEELYTYYDAKFHIVFVISNNTVLKMY